MNPSRFWILAWSMVLFAAAAALGTVVPRAHRAGVRAQSQLAVFARVAAEAQELARLRAAGMVDQMIAQSKESAKLAPAVSAALSGSGLPTSALSSLSPESESTKPVGGPTGNQVRIVRKRATLVLTPVTLPQLGRFLQTWRQRSPEWTVDRLELDPRPIGGGSAAAPPPGSDLPLRVVVGLESLTLQPRAPIGGSR